MISTNGKRPPTPADPHHRPGHITPGTLTPDGHTVIYHNPTDRVLLLKKQGGMYSLLQHSRYREAEEKQRTAKGRPCI